MTAPANRWKLGLFVIAGFGLSLVGFTMIGVHELKRPKHIAWCYFDEALTGLEEGSPVRFRGVRIGVVDRIDVGDDRKHLAVMMSIYDDYLGDLGLKLDQTEHGDPVETNLRAQVVMSWVTSTAFVQVDFFPDPPSGPQQLPFPAEPNTLRTVPSTAKSLESAGREVLRELPALIVSARELVELLHRDLQSANLPDLTSRLDRVLVAVEGELAEVRRRGTVAAVSGTLDAIRDTAQSLRADQGPVASVLAELRALAADLHAQVDAAAVADTAASLRRAADSTTELATSLHPVGESVQAELAHLRSALAAVERLAGMLENDPGSLLHGRGAAPKSPLPGGSR
jgi:ABC-type transporter Mla subunit MlaD